MDSLENIRRSWQCDIFFFLIVLGYFHFILMNVMNLEIYLKCSLPFPGLARSDVKLAEYISLIM